MNALCRRHTEKDQFIARKWDGLDDGVVFATRLIWHPDSHAMWVAIDE